MKILITGVKGVIGSKLEEVLLKRGHKVFGVDLFHTNKEYGHGLGKVSEDNYFRCDISEYRQLEEIVSYVKPEFVYNCAAEFGRWNGEHFYEQVWKTNAIGVKNVIRLQEKYKFKLIHFSSSEVYGDYQDVMYEDVLNRVPITQMNDYAISKRVNEMQIENSRVMNKTETAIVRIFNTYGPGEWYHPFRSVNCTFTYNLLHGKPIKVFKGHTRTSTYIYDAVNAMANICERFESGQYYNIASSERHTIEDLAQLIVKYTNANPSLVEYADQKEILTTKDKIVDNNKAVHQLGFKSTVSLEDGVKNTVEWMKKHYNIGE
jgi:dTDP-glucose 4,6-dehydratase